MKRLTTSLQAMPQYCTGTNCCQGCADLKDTIQKLQETISRQNEAIMKVLAEQRVLSERVLHQEVSNNNVRSMFPVKSLNDLKELDNAICAENRELHINIMKSLLKGRLPKTLPEVLSTSVCMDVNVDGIHKKKRFKDFKAFFEALTDACRSIGCFEAEKDLRSAQKIIKKCVRRKNYARQ